MTSKGKSLRLRLLSAGVTLAAIAVGACKGGTGNRPAREALWEELRPVALKNCEIKRIGSANDGGYLMCANLLKGAESIYSYGVDQEDNWGCVLSKELNAPVHQYDCFTEVRPTCPGGKFDFHAECVGPKAETQKSKPFDTIAAQIEKNGDKGKRLIMKVDVEGAEWDSVMATPDDVLDKIEQLPMELHGINEMKFAEVVRKLKKTFWLVSVHFNNYACDDNAAPLPARAYQVLFVNKRVAELDPSKPGRTSGSAPDAPDNPKIKDCQPEARK